MWQMLAQIMAAKKALDSKKNNLRSSMPGANQVSNIQNQVNDIQERYTPEPIQQMQEFPYKLKAGLGVNLGMPMDTFMSSRDFKRTGTAMPNRNDPTTGLIGSLRNYYGGGFGR